MPLPLATKEAFVLRRYAAFAVLGTHVRKRLGRLGEQPEQLWASNPVMVQVWWLQG